jgi:hypothetical protein
MTVEYLFEDRRNLSTLFLDTVLNFAIVLYLYFHQEDCGLGNIKSAPRHNHNAFAIVVGEHGRGIGIPSKQRLFIGEKTEIICGLSFSLF